MLSKIVIGFMVLCLTFSHTQSIAQTENPETTTTALTQPTAQPLLQSNTQNIESVPTLENSPLMQEVSTFGSTLKNPQENEVTREDLLDLIRKIQDSPNLDVESKVKSETILTRAYENGNNKRTVNTAMVEVMGVLREGTIHQNPKTGTLNSSQDKPLSLYAPLPISTQANPFVPFPGGYLGYNMKDQLERCIPGFVTDVVLNTNYKDLNLQLRNRFKHSTLDEIAQIIIDQRAWDQAAYATLSSSALYGASLVAYYAPEKIGGAGKGTKLIGGKLSAVTGAAAYAGYLMYVDICTYAKANARMFFQLVDLYDTGAFYTLDEKQDRTFHILLLSMGFKVSEKFLLEGKQSLNVGAMTVDLLTSIGKNTGLFLQGIFEQAATGIKKGSQNIIARSEVTTPTPTPPRPTLPGGNVPTPSPQVPTAPTVPGRPNIGLPTMPGINPGGFPGAPGQPVEIEISKISPWALLSIPANASLTYFSMQAYGKLAVSAIKKEREKVYKLPMDFEYIQEAVFKLLIFASIKAQIEEKTIKASPIVAPSLGVQQPGLSPRIGLMPPAGTEPRPLQIVSPNPISPFPPKPPGTNPTVPTPGPVAVPNPTVPAKGTLQSQEQRVFIQKLFEKYNPHLNTSSPLYFRILAEMNSYDSGISQDSVKVFANELLDNVPGKMAILEQVLRILYLDHSFSARENDVVEHIRFNVMGFQDKYYSDLIYKMKIELRNSPD